MHYLLFVVLTGIITASFSQTIQPDVIRAMPASARSKCVTTVPGRMTVEYGTTSVQAMAGAIERLLKDEELRRRLAEAGRALAREMFDPQKHAGEVMEAYRKVLARSLQNVS